ncbi:MAG: hypothetical protein ACXVCR_02750 [Bdellovibrio sp.]
MKTQSIIKTLMKNSILMAKLILATALFVSSVSLADSGDIKIYQNECLNRLMVYCRKNTTDHELFKQAAEYSKNCSNWNAVAAVSSLATSFCGYGVDGHITQDAKTGIYSEEHRNSSYDFKFYVLSSQLSIDAIKLASKVQNNYQFRCIDQIIDQEIRSANTYAGNIDTPINNNSLVPAVDFEICLQE